MKQKRIVIVLEYAAIIALVVYIIAPFLWLVIMSISTAADLTEKPLKWIPAKPTFDSRRSVFIRIAEQFTHFNSYGFHFPYSDRSRSVGFFALSRKKGFYSSLRRFHIYAAARRIRSSSLPLFKQRRHAR